jgi:hypothetical protein
VTPLIRSLRSRRTAAALLLAPVLVLAACEAAPHRAGLLTAQEPLTRDRFASLVERVSERGGYFDTDNLISNEAGYLKVVDALRERGVESGAFVGVGPDQNYSYIAAVRPEVAFIVDVRRDNLLHHLLLKALIERARTRVEFLAGLHGVSPPDEPAAWRDRDIEEIVTYVDDSPTDIDRASRLADEIEEAIDGYGLELSEDDHATIRRFHRTFVEAGTGLRFTSYGRAPRPYYPSYRQLLLETDIDGDRASYLATAEGYGVVRELHLANRIVPVVGDLSGPDAVRELGSVMREMGVALTAFYASNVEFYLWQAGTFERWVANLRALPIDDHAVVIRSYFPNAGRAHPSAVAGYYATQSLQPVSTLLGGSFATYWDMVTRDAVMLQPR